MFNHNYTSFDVQLKHTLISAVTPKHFVKLAFQEQIYASFLLCAFDSLSRVFIMNLFYTKNCFGHSPSGRSFTRLFPFPRGKMGVILA